jgi:diaminopimelate epimerase
MEQVSFAKLSGAGNDFVVIDNRENVIQIPPNPPLQGGNCTGRPSQEGKYPVDEADFVRKICARRVSVGADGLLLVENSDVADFKMRYFNSDGSEVETCGNGARCIARFAYVEKIVSSSEMNFETRAGIYGAQVMKDNVKLRMGDATGMKLNFPLTLSDGQGMTRPYTVSFVNTGVPHTVFFVDDLDAVDVVKLGRETRCHGDFQPEGTNANFVRVRDAGALDIRTYERGVEDETLACGTGCIAAAIIAAAVGEASSPVVAHTRGGYPLKIYFTLESQGAKEVFLEGDARVIYRGYLLKDSWVY